MSKERANGMVVCGNALEVLRDWPDAYFDSCITSPPYWGLRSYPGTEVAWPDGWFGSLGLEPDFHDYIRHLMQITEQVKRVLKPIATCWVVIGDSYISNPGDRAKVGGFQGKASKERIRAESSMSMNKHKTGLPPKSLCQIPSRFALAMTDAGWILRNHICWHKANTMPSSAKDRFTVNWESVFFFVKQPRYYFKQQLEPATQNRLGGHTPINTANSKDGNNQLGELTRERDMMPETRNMRCVWDIPIKHSGLPHFAQFSDTLVEPMLRAGCPSGGTVLDPFAGMCTVGVVAARLGMDFIGIELSEEYARKSEGRIRGGAGEIVKDK